jgi:hypothetical protein
MKNQKIAIATIVATILIFVLDFLFYAVLMDNPGGGECCMKEMPDMVWMILGDLVFGLAFVMIYDKTSGKTGVSSGVTYGIWIAVLTSIAMNMVWYSLMENMEMSMMIKDMLYGVVKFGIIGAAVGFLLGGSGGDRGNAAMGGDRGKTSGGGEMESGQTGGGERGKTTGSGE